jgi:sugar O-acyltransferase (sialic acid O-acetyltransferase NeuD family)
MSRILLLGGGGHCRACIDVIETENMHSISGILVANDDPTKELLGYSVLGHDNDLPTLLGDAQAALVTVGQIKSADARIRLFNDLLLTGLDLPVIQSPLAHRSRHSSVGRGTILMHGVVINAHATIGDNCVINSQALIEHDVEIGDHCHVSTGARVNGGVVVGERSFVGSGVVIKQGVRIGADVVIGAGQTVLKDLPDGSWLTGGAS